MKLIEITPENLKKLLKCLRAEDKEELKQTFGKNFREKFTKISLQANEKYFLSDEDDNPLAIGGVEPYPAGKFKIGQVWLISSIYFTDNKLKLAKFIKNKIEDFKKRNDILFNIIHKSNFTALKWLKRCGFKVMNLKNKDYKLFYYTKGGIDFDLRYITR